MELHRVLVILVLHWFAPAVTFEIRSHIPNNFLAHRREATAPATCDLSTAPPVMWTATKDGMPTVYLVGTIKVDVELVQPLPHVFEQVLNITRSGGLWVERKSDHRNDPQYHLYLLWKCHTYQTPGGTSKIQTRLSPQRFQALLQHTRKIGYTLQPPYSTNVLNLATMAQNGMAALSYYHNGQIESYYLNVLSFIFIVEENRKANARPHSYQPGISVFKGEQANQTISEYLAHASARVSSLESFEDQCTVYRDRSTEQESLAVKEWAEEPIVDQLNNSSVPLGVDAWRCGNTSLLGGDGGLQTLGEIEWFKDEVAFLRNAKMARGIIMASVATRFPILVAIGTSHLAYNTTECPSVLELMEQSGYQVTRLTNPQDLNSQADDSHRSFWLRILWMMMVGVVCVILGVWCLLRKPYQQICSFLTGRESRPRAFHSVSRTNLLDAEGAAPGDSVKLAAQHALLVDVSLEDNTEPTRTSSLL